MIKSQSVRCTPDSASRLAELERQRRAIVQAVPDGLALQDDPGCTVLTDAFTQGMAVLRDEIAAIQQRIAELTAQGCVQATAHYRKHGGQPKHLYLIHPTAPDGTRRREYVGADPDRQALRQRQAAYRTALIQLRQALRTIEQGWAYS